MYKKKYIYIYTYIYIHFYIPVLYPFGPGMGTPQIFGAFRHLNQEGTDNAAADAVSTSGTTIRTVDALLALLEARVLHWSQARKADECLSAVAAVRALGLLLDRLVHCSAAGRLHNALLVRLGVVAALPTICQPESHGNVPGESKNPFQAKAPQDNELMDSVVG